MKREDVLKLFPEATEEQIKTLMDLNGSDINSAKSKAVTDKMELDRLKAIETDYETLKGTTMTAEQKYQKALEDMTATAKKSTRELNKMKAENILVSAGLKADDYATLIDGLVKDTAEETVSFTTGFANLLKSQIEATEKKVKTDLLQGMGTPPAGQGGTTTTKEQFEKMDYTDRLKVYDTNKELYNQLNSPGGE